MAESESSTEVGMGRSIPSPYRYTVRCFYTHESLGPGSDELAKAYESALKGGQRFVTINPHASPRKVYVEHGYRGKGP